MIDLTIDTDRIRRHLAEFIRSQVHNAGFQRVVIGLSGGLDSALACYLSVEALGAENVLGIRMPYRTSSPQSLTDAQLVIDAVGIESMTIDISPIADGLIDRFPEMDQKRRGNIMARCRMIVLYDQSAATRSLVVGTGNRTEILLGYSTLWGDAACAFNPLGSLYKTQVRQLARAMGVPEPILVKAPSADLWVGQTDEGELGVTYAEVDQLLYMLEDQHASLEECVRAGFTESMVQGVINHIQANAFKRSLPPIANLT